jgi:hypothetical protein
VLREKAAGDYDRFFKGTTKTRERLGVRGQAAGGQLAHSVASAATSAQAVVDSLASVLRAMAAPG